MSKDFSKLLPDPKERSNQKISPETVLIRLSDTFNDRYQGHISTTVTSSGSAVDGKNENLSFTFYLQSLFLTKGVFVIELSQKFDIVNDVTSLKNCVSKNSLVTYTFVHNYYLNH